MSSSGQAAASVTHGPGSRGRHNNYWASRDKSEKIHHGPTHTAKTHYPGPTPTLAAYGQPLSPDFPSSAFCCCAPAAASAAAAVAVARLQCMAAALAVACTVAQCVSQSSLLSLVALSDEQTTLASPQQRWSPAPTAWPQPVCWPPPIVPDHGPLGGAVARSQLRSILPSLTPATVARCRHQEITP